MADTDDLLIAFELHYDNLKLLLAAGGRAVPPLDNVPNRYLQPKT
jgi:hypothetical protein